MCKICATLEQAIAARDKAALDQLCDRGAALDKAFAGINLEAEILDSFKKAGVQKASAQLLEMFDTSHNSTASVQFVHTYRIGSQPVLLFRFWDNSLNYSDFRLVARIRWDRPRRRLS